MSALLFNRLTFLFFNGIDKISRLISSEIFGKTNSAID
jgi:hypothetical protein